MTTWHVVSMEQPEPPQPPTRTQPPQCTISKKTLVLTFLLIPFVSIALCVATSLANSDEPVADTISAMVLAREWTKILFGVALGISTVMLVIAFWILRVRLLWPVDELSICNETHHLLVCPNVFLLILSMTMATGCVGLAIKTLDDDFDGHVLFAAIALGSQLILTTAIVAIAWADRPEVEYNHPVEAWWRACARPHLRVACFALACAILSACLFALHVSAYAYVFEFFLIMGMYVALLYVNHIPWESRVTAWIHHEPHHATRTRRPVIELTHHRPLRFTDG